MTPKRRQEIMDIYARVCKDSRFRMDMIDAAHFAAKVFGGIAADVWFASDFSTMERLANGTHPYFESQAKKRT